jgi:epoxyqueuosine reductase
MQKELAQLAGQGLNVYASASLESLPADLREYFPAGFRNVLVFGHGGRELWERLPKPLDPAEHPVDRYAVSLVEAFSRDVLRDYEARILFPFSETLLPLQRLGRALNLARPSLLGLDIHPEYGVWFAYRCVLVTKADVPPSSLAQFASPCESCVEKPCRPVCPAGAVGAAAESFSLNACAGYRFSENSKCESQCLSRFACSYKPEHRYSDEQMRYHMVRAAHLRKLREFV